MSLRNRAERSPKGNSQEKKQKLEAWGLAQPRGAPGPPLSWRGSPEGGKMSPWALAVWLPLNLLLLWLPGCCLLRGPSRVTGTQGGSLSLQFWYEEKYKTYNKYWCRSLRVLGRCRNTVDTKDSEREVSRGRMSISDHPEDLTFTVTLKNLSLEDTGSYWCGIGTPWHEGPDDYFRVAVSVLPASSSKNNRSTLEPPTLRPPTLEPPPKGSGTTRKAMPSPSPQPGSLLSSVHFLLLVFLKLPLLLGMLSAVLWVNRPLKIPKQQVE
ncbi:PREDICTED: CMRF35-like molecule 6 isoform X2 [Dipodomys ordii]|uniref:CMRF35-like molecule 6 isoform X2 n=1 Tax=Dipodomys ordii TaxID=10020 RepID=A0A1S3GRS4_DIPOR|nr:PREDICTED: CMRF35-like molecule 6 isoform X2 [Dipodomys ordii]